MKNDNDQKIDKVMAFGIYSCNDIIEILEKYKDTHEFMALTNNSANGYSQRYFSNKIVQDQILFLKEKEAFKTPRYVFGVDLAPELTISEMMEKVADHIWSNKKDWEQPSKPITTSWHFANKLRKMAKK